MDFEDLMDHPDKTIRLQEQYGSVATGQLSNDEASVRAIATSFGYTESELSSLPSQANMGLSCGNPLALAALRAGEVVVDLGCGGGLDVFLAAQRVGSTGRVIGVDMTAAMLQRARDGQRQLGLTNVEFLEANLVDLPIPSEFVDCVISNCVINLVPDKAKAFREILRILKPGGRIALSDIALKQTLPSHVQQSLEAYVGCISGAILIADYARLLREAGFESIVISESGSDLNVYAQAGGGSTNACCGSGCDPAPDDASGSDSAGGLHAALARVLESFDANEFAASVRVHALKPARQGADVTSTSLVHTLPESSTMKTVKIFDKPMCCSTGVCGPDVDPVLPRFAADLDWLQSLGHHVERFNLAQQPQAFIDHPLVHQRLSRVGTECLPLILVQDQVVSEGAYPDRTAMAEWIAEEAVAKPPTVRSLPMSGTGDGASGGCGCGPSGCC